MEQFKRFRPEFRPEVARDSRSPANFISLIDAIQYCRWLSERESISKDQMCYPPESEIALQHAVLAEAARIKTGYRLLTRAEWEYACRAGSTTPWFCGDIEQQMEEFAWFAKNSRGHLQPVGRLMPNPFGLFDIVGNVTERCHAPSSDPTGVCGGSYNDLRLRSDEWQHLSNTGYSFTGFRIVRTVPRN